MKQKKNTDYTSEPKHCYSLPADLCCIWADDIKVTYFVVRFQVLTATNMMITAFWGSAPCSLVEVDRLSEPSTSTTLLSTNIPEGFSPFAASTPNTV
jgi:hypothetical protein